MKINLNDIPDDQFEEIIAALMRAMSYDNVVVRTGGSDEGWDIDGQTLQQLPDGKVQIEHWRVECKRYKSYPPAQKIRDHYQRMVKTQPIPTHLLFVTTSKFSNPVKIDLNSFAETDRVYIHWWEKTQLNSLIEKYLNDPYLYSLISNYVELIFSLELLQKACKNQVNKEIQSHVGRKYLPDLCQARPIENDIFNFILTDLQELQLQEIGEKLKKLKPLNLQAESSVCWDNAIELICRQSTWRDAEPIFQNLFELVDDKKKDIIKQTIDGVKCLQRNCFLIKDKAGSGKTNLLCRLATINKQPKILSIYLSCKFNLTIGRSLADIIIGSIITGIESLRIKGDNAPVLGRNEHDLINSIGFTLHKESVQLVVYMDGINENRDLAVLDEAIINLMVEWNHLPIKFIITCRDIFWSFFTENRWSRLMFDKKAHDLPGFDDAKIDDIIDAYFNAFGITGHLMGNARDRCRHPLILRFFCEAFHNQALKDFEDLRLKDLFDHYWLRKKQDISESLGFGGDGGWRIEDFLFKVIDHMSDIGITQIPIYNVRQLTGEQDMESNRSIYKHLLDQDIILEELPPDKSFDRSFSARRVSFVYDEFYDYLMAMAHIRKNNWDNIDNKYRCFDILQLIHRTSDFEQLNGVIEYLILLSEPTELMVESEHLSRILCALLSRLGKYEILCNVLPKLRDQSDWMEEVLRNCILSFGVSKMNKTTQKSSNWTPEFDFVEKILIKNDQDKLYPFLLIRL
jgi:hypothetical protein